MLGFEFNPQARTLFALPVKLAGLGIVNPTATSISALKTSQKATSHLSSAIRGQSKMDMYIHQHTVTKARMEHKVSRKQESVATLNAVIQTFQEQSNASYVGQLII